MLNFWTIAYEISRTIVINEKFIERNCPETRFLVDEGNFNKLDCLQAKLFLSPRPHPLARSDSLTLFTELSPEITCNFEPGLSVISFDCLRLVDESDEISFCDIV